MYFLVESKEQLDELPLTKECFVQVIALSSFYHPKLTTPCLVYYRGRHGAGQEWSKGYILCVNHSESFSLNFKDVQEFIRKHSIKYCLDVKYTHYFLDDSIFLNDVNFVRLRNELKVIKDQDHNTKVHDYFYNKFKTNSEVNKLIPIVKHYEKWENIFNQECKDNFFNNLGDVSFNYKEMEENGIKIDENLFYKYFQPDYGPFSIKDSKVYTSYNLYNPTTRPTNHFNNINFSALPKESRECFIPENDYFLEFDYEGYHPRLIADLIQYKGFNQQEPIYKQLAKLYFDKDDEESTKLAKEYTFKQIYGGIEEKYLKFEYFRIINEYIEYKWKEYNEKGINLLDHYTPCPKGLNKNQMFNYLIQSLETSKNRTVIFDANLKLKQYKTKLIYYNYDSFLLDASEKEDLEDIYKIITKDYPIKTFIGKNYRDMEKVNIYTHKQ